MELIQMTEEKDAPRTKRRGGVFFALLALAFVFASPHAFATVQVSQLDGTTNQSGYTSSYWGGSAGGLVQTLASTTTSFPFGSLTVYAKSSDSRQINMQVIDCGTSSGVNLQNCAYSGSSYTHLYNLLPTTWTTGTTYGTNIYASTTPTYAPYTFVSTTSPYTTPFNIDPTHRYLFLVYEVKNSGGNTLVAQASSADGYVGGQCNQDWYNASPSACSSKDLSFILSDDPNYQAPVTSTQIISSVPANGAFFVSTSTSGNTVSFNYYVAPADFTTGMVIQGQVTYYDYSVDPLGDAVNTNFSHTILSTEVGAPQTWVATTTMGFPLSGEYEITASINTPPSGLAWVLQIFGNVFATFQANYTSQFTVVAKNASDVVGDSLQTAINNIASGSVGAGISSSCAIQSFNAGTCFLSLFIPSVSDLSNIMTAAEHGFLAAFPWGYVTRVFMIATNQATSTLPVITVVAPTMVEGNAFPIHATLTEDVFGNLPTAQGSFFSGITSPDGQTFRQVVEPYWLDLLRLGWIIAVVTKVLGYSIFSGGSGGSDGMDEQGGDITYTRREERAIRQGGSRWGGGSGIIH